jgi:hypothetical protein
MPPKSFTIDIGNAVVDDVEFLRSCHRWLPDWSGYLT